MGWFSADFQEVGSQWTQRRNTRERRTSGVGGIMDPADILVSRSVPGVVRVKR
jgi:hypothetical protein